MTEETDPAQPPEDLNATDLSQTGLTQQSGIPQQEEALLFNWFFDLHNY